MDKCEILAEKSEMDAEYHQKFPDGSIPEEKILQNILYFCR